MLRVLICFFASLIIKYSLCALPPVLNYSGQVVVNGESFDGIGFFKFALVNMDGNITYWSNDGVSSSGLEPQAIVRVPVNGGLYSILLGNTEISGMSKVDPSLFAEHSDINLRVWFSDGVNGFHQLTPDRPFASVPFAFNSQSANTSNSVVSGGINKSMLAQDVLSALNSRVSGSQITENSITTAQLNEQILKYLKPEIVRAPEAPGLIFDGQTVSLYSQAEGKFLSYQWYKDGQSIIGATNDNHVIEDVNKSQHDGNYTLLVSNDFGSVTTSPTTINVNSTPMSHTVKSIDMDMTFCHSGTFTIGSPTHEEGRGADEVEHQVILSNGFYLGTYEVTQAQYQAIMAGNSKDLSEDPSHFKGSNRPVEGVSWNDIQVFLSRLNEIEKTAGHLPTGWKYMLPTEAQWEYACRAGTNTTYNWGDDKNSSRANFNWNDGPITGNDYKQTREVGQYAANQWGFFDMHGNVSEWVQDWKSNFTGATQVDPQGPESGSSKVCRGGSWYNDEFGVRSAKRGGNPLTSSYYVLGFRVSLQAE